MAGCCHGRVTDAWYGIYHINLDATVVPVQLFESMFLFGLCVILAVLASKKIPGTMAIYMSTYGVWRVFAETLRDDYRGSTIIESLTPSQLTSIILIVLSVPVFLYTLYIYKKNKSAKERGSEEE
jgi:phosphatidylglycerol:prolipoprotein diacylglycerol transferase